METKTNKRMIITEIYSEKFDLQFETVLPNVPNHSDSIGFWHNNEFNISCIKRIIYSLNRQNELESIELIVD